MTDFVLYIQKSTQQHITFTHILYSIYIQIVDSLYITQNIQYFTIGNPKFCKLEFH